MSTGPEGSNVAKSNDKPSCELRKAEASTTSATPPKGNNPIVLKPRTYSTYTKKEIPREDRIWDTIPGCQNCRGHSFETRISKCVTNMVRHRDQCEREDDGAMHWDNILPVLKGRFQNQLEKGNSRMITGYFAFILEASRQGLKSLKM